MRSQIYQFKLFPIYRDPKWKRAAGLIIYNIDIHRASYAKLSRSKSHFENLKLGKLNIPELLFQASNENKLKKLYNPKPLREIARENIR